MDTSIPTRYEEDFAQRVGSARAFAFWKGRVAMYAILKALGVGAGDEVILPGYTCVMAVNPIIYLGAKPVYVDIEPVTYNIDPPLIEPRITRATKAIVAQHTYGYPASMDDIVAVASERGIPVIEDCCLALGSTYRGRVVGTFGVAAYWSSQWNKPYTTGLGGMATTSEPELAKRIEAIQRDEAVRPSRRELAALRLQLAAYRSFVYPKTTALAQTIFRSLTKAGLVVGSSGSEEFEPVMPEGFLKGMGGVQTRVGLRQLRRLDRDAAHRRRMRHVYDELLAAIDWPLPSIPKDIDPVLVRYPVRVKDKERALHAAAKHWVEIGSWFECPLHPKETPLARYGYTPGLCPAAERACREAINLPLHPRAGEATARRTVRFIAGIGAADSS